MNIGKKILSALVELPAEGHQASHSRRTSGDVQTKMQAAALPNAETEKFRAHFEQLLGAADRPGYVEFQRMIAAMGALSDEKARFAAAFAGLQVQGLTRVQLLESAKVQLALLDEDKTRFAASLETARQEKVATRHAELQANTERLAELGAEILRLQDRNTVLETEIGEQEERLQRNGLSYAAASEEVRTQILSDIERISTHLS